MKSILFSVAFIFISLLKLNAQLSANLSNSINPTCANLCNGSVTITVAGAQGNHYYALTGPVGSGTISGDIITNLCAGSYTIEVTDDNLLEVDSIEFELTEPLPLYSDIMPAGFNCLSVCNGMILTNISGGTPPYQYNWQPAVSTMDYAENLCPGDYSLTVIDVNGCSDTQTLTTVVIPDLTVSLTHTNSTCDHACDGKISANVNAGIFPYYFLWENTMSATPDVDRLCPGFYKLTVIDGAGCAVSDSTNITNLGHELTNIWPELNLINETCLNAGDGAINTTLIGSNPGPFTYVWNNGASTQNIANLSTGDYELVLYDATMYCIATATPLTADGINCGSISGKVFTDNNTNCMNDAGDNDYPNAMILVNPGNKLGYANMNGEYTINNLPYATYTISFVNNPANVSLSCGSTLTVTLDAGNPTAIDQDFATIFNSASQPDIQVSGWDNGIVPGFNSTMNYSIQNHNIAVANGIFKATLPSAFIPNIISASPATYTLTGDTLMWNFSNLAYLGSKAFSVNFTVPVSTPLASNFVSCMLATTTVPDLNTNNNVYCHSSLVTGSFDPNDKAASPVGFGPTGNITPSETDLTYLIRFQNTGNGPAHFIVVRDTLSANLDLSTLQMVSASHDYNLEILDGNILKWKFDNIMLPDSGSNEPGSHGYIQYKISRNSVNTPGTQIKNTAYIYFDFNEPVVTNTTLNTIAIPTGIISEKNNSNEWTIYPNPSNGVLYLANHKTSIEESQIQVINSLGQTVYNDTINVNQKTIDLSKLNNGIYFVKVTSDKQTTIKRIVLSK